MKKIALALFTLTLVILIVTPSMKPKKLEKILLPDLNLTDIAVIERTSPTEGKVTLFYDQNTRIWRVKELDGYPAYSERIREVLYGISTLQPMGLRTANKERYAELGLDTAKAQHVVLADSSGKVFADLWFGNITVDEATTFRAIYVRKDGEDQTYSVIPGIDVSGYKEQFAFPFLTNFQDDSIKELKFFAKGKEVKVRKNMMAGFMKDLDFITVKKDTGEKSDTVIRFVMNDLFDVNFTYLSMNDGNWIRIEIVPTSTALKDHVSTLVKALTAKHSGYVYKIPLSKNDMIQSLMKRAK